MPVFRYEDFAEKYLTVGKRSGKNWSVLCEFHDDNTPSMSFEVERGLYHCWSCGAKGNIARLAAQLGMEVKDNGYVEILDDPDADLDSLLRSLDDLDSPPPAALTNVPEEWLQRFDDKQIRHDYWHGSRGFARATIKAWRLGGDRMANHATIPLRTDDGDVVGVIRRQLAKGAHPRYLNPKGFDKRLSLFGVSMLDDKRGSGSHVVLTEGPLDAIRVWEAGFPGLAILGSALSVEQARALHRLGTERVTLFFDNDEPGFKIAEDAVALLVDDFDLDAAVYRYGMPDDPGGMTREQAKQALFDAIALNYAV